MKIFSRNFLIFFLFLLKTYNRGSSNEYPQSMFWSKNKKNSPAYPNFLHKSGVKGVYVAPTCFPDKQGFDKMKDVNSAN